VEACRLDVHHCILAVPPSLQPWDGETAFEVFERKVADAGDERDGPMGRIVMYITSLDAVYVILLCRGAARGPPSVTCAHII
jgi:hypothetical protein